ncbi:MAG TPA: ATP synthase F0 subunit B [Enhygromyxa sp.]|nr:ATP synthase F0 subunit B [Enhygromyxa sp.]
MLIALASESLPVVDIDNTIFLQALLFLFLLVVLNFVLFQPWLEVKERRAKRIGGALEDAAELRERATATERDYVARLAKARDEAMTIRSDRRREADEQEAAIVGDARREAAASLDARKAVLSREVEQARAELSGRVDSLAQNITSQVLGRSA